MSTVRWTSKPVISPHAAPTTTTLMPFTTSEPEVDVHLTAPLSKPLHHFTEEELYGLVSELEHDRFLEQEAHIARLTEDVYLAWRGRTAMQSIQIAVPVSSYSFSPGGLTVQNSATVTLNIPESIPDAYAKAFIERMIRDQLEEG